MGYTNFKNNEEPALNNTTLNNMQKGLLELVFPIGSTYVTQTDTNPSTILGFGTWERLKGKVCLGLDEDDNDLKTIGNTGGEKTHTLTVNEMPAHRHEVNNLIAGHGSTNDWSLTASIVPNGGKTFVNAEGGNQSHNNMQPYQVVGYMWIRKS